MTFDEWWESDEAFKFRHNCERVQAAAAWGAAANYFRNMAYDNGFRDGADSARKECAEACDEEAKAMRREGEGSTNAQYDWMADGAERCADTLRSNAEVSGARRASSGLPG